MTKDELTSMQPARNSGQIMGPGVDEIFARLDANHDGGIDESENLASMQPSETRRQRQPRDASEIARALFERADADTDGKLTKEEFLLLSRSTRHRRHSTSYLRMPTKTETVPSLSQSSRPVFESISRRAAYDRLGQTNAISESRFSIMA